MTDAPTLGHNQPPDDPFERAAELVANANKWIAERPVIEDDEQAGAGQLAIDQLNKAKEDLEAAREKEREPHDLAIVAIRTRFRDPLELIGIAKTRLQQIMGLWLSKKRDRLAAEKAEQERIAQEARDRANAAIVEAVTQPSVEADLKARRATEDAAKLSKLAAKPTGRAQVRGDYSDRAVSLRENWRAEITDETLALRSYAKHPQIRTAALAKIVKVASAEAREFKDESKAKPGTKFLRTEKAV
jgi:hypothetical protein